MAYYHVTLWQWWWKLISFGQATSANCICAVIMGVVKACGLYFGCHRGLLGWYYMTNSFWLILPALLPASHQPWLLVLCLSSWGPQLQYKPVHGCLKGCELPLIPPLSVLIRGVGPILLHLLEQTDKGDLISGIQNRRSSLLIIIILTITSLATFEDQLWNKLHIMRGCL